MKNTYKTPLVSIVLPVYNGISYLTETIQSIDKNTYKNVEVILINDGSTDESDTLCKKLQKKYPYINYFSFKKNNGLAQSLNFAIQKAKGSYIARINQDDIMLPHRLSQQVAFLTNHTDHVAVGGNIELFTDDNKTIDTMTFFETNEQIRKYWLYLSPFSDPAVLYRKSAFLKTKGYQKKFWPVDDVHMWYQLGEIGKLANIPHVVTKVRWHPAAGSLKSHRKQIQKLWELHLWAALHIQMPSLFIGLFWVGQYCAGLLFPPEFNWIVFRLIRKLHLKPHIPQQLSFFS